MTPEEIRNNVWANRYAQQAVELVAVLVDLNVAQQRIKYLEGQIAEIDKTRTAVSIPSPTATVTPIKKEGEHGD